MDKLCLFETLLGFDDLKLFQKDKDRRFLGCNQAFLDYYDFTLDDILGKTDEEVGQHVDPNQFVDNEIDVITKGIPVTNQQGKCISKGQLRDIVASKYPIIVNGEIIGLMGCFFDVSDVLDLETVSYTDDLTGLGNRRMFEEIVNEYKNIYKEQNLDFVLYFIELEQYDDDTLKNVANKLLKIVNNDGTIYRQDINRFCILQNSKGNPTNLKYKISESLSDVNISIGYDLYSVCKNIGTLIKSANEHMLNDKKERI